MLLMTLLTLAGAVHPTAAPSTPQPAEAVVIRFKADKTRDGTYRAEATLKGCSTRSSGTRNAAAKGHDVRLRIRPPRSGWCAGTYKATVYFKQEQHCPPTISCGGTADVAIGSTRFTVGG
ncbi:hypothetical protein [Solirubrobacter soli]|uniref:hypothetical protein n=1 Tax=Solirubrobacter soli TaxID=363832 RepID=UPI0003F7CC86|nr:hypothetical protein [Solirubrobacter soli]